MTAVARRTAALVLVCSCIGGAEAAGKTVRSPALPGKIAFVRGWSIVGLDLRTRRARRLTGIRGVRSFRPAWSPNGRLLAFARERLPAAQCNGCAQDLYVRRRSGALRRLSTNPDNVYFYDPSWSPSARRLAFARGTPSEVAAYWMRADGTALHRLRGGAGEPDWAPRRARIALSSGWSRPGGGIVIVRSRNGRVVRSIRAPDAQFPAWSPDGRRLAYMLPAVSRRGKPVRPARLVVFDLAKRRVIRRLRVRAASRIDWSPDGRFLVFGCGKLYTVRAARGKPSLLVRNGCDASWSRRG